MAEIIAEGEWKLHMLESVMRTERVAAGVTAASYALGIRVVTDERVPLDEVWLVDGERIVGKIVGLGEDGPAPVCPAFVAASGCPPEGTL